MINFQTHSQMLESNKNTAEVIALIFFFFCKSVLPIFSNLLSILHPLLKKKIGGNFFQNFPTCLILSQQAEQISFLFFIIQR